MSSLHDTFFGRTTENRVVHGCSHPEFVAKLKADNGSLIVWVDYMKLGRVTTQDLNLTMDCIRKALACMPERSVAFAIGPHLVSERRSGIRAELRTLNFLSRQVVGSQGCNTTSF